MSYNNPQDLSNSSIDIQIDVTNYDVKKKLITDELDRIKIKKQKHYKRFSRLKKVNTIIKTTINLLNAVSISSIVMSYDYLSVCSIIALVSSSISSLLSVGLSSYEIDNKISLHHTTAQQLNDLYRSINLRVLKNNLSSTDLDEIILDLNDRLSIIEDVSLPL